MADWPRILLVCLALSLGAGAGRAETGRAETDADLHSAIGMALASDVEDEVLAVLADRLAGSVVLPATPEAGEGPGGPPDVRAGDIQAALTQLSILSGANGHLALQLSQGERGDVIHILSGRARLADLAAAGELATKEGEIWRLKRPLVVWPGATLTIGPDEVLEMEAEGGAFLLSFGAVSIRNATVRGNGGINSGVKEFRPFLLVTGQGTLSAVASSFQNLGYRGPVAFRGVSVMTAGVMKPETAPVLTENRFSGVFSLSLEGADRMHVVGNWFHGAEAAAISVKDGRWLVIAENRINGTLNGAGVRLSGALQDVLMAGNVITGGGRNGVQIDGTTSGLTFRGNVVARNAGAGVTLGRAACVTIRGNIIARNGASGLRLTETGAAEVAGNAIWSNGSAGIELRAQAGLHPILMTGNMLRRNREGLRAAGLGEVQLRGNDLAGQTPRQFAGDFSPWLGAYLSSNDGLLIPAVTGSQPAAPLPCQTE